jgi:hypothetical protein
MFFTHIALELIGYSGFLSPKDAMSLCTTAKNFRDYIDLFLSSLTQLVLANTFYQRPAYAYTGCNFHFPLAKFARLQSLSLYYTSIKQVPDSLTDLETLQVCNADTALLKNLQSPELKVLLLNAPRCLTIEDLCEFLNRCPKLHCLAIKGVDCRVENLFAQCFRGLEKLYLGDAIVKDLSTIRTTPHGLRRLVIGLNTNMALTRHVECSEITELIYEAPFICHGSMATFIGKCHKLVYLSVRSTHMSFGELLSVCPPTLRKLKYYGMEITADQILPMKNLQITHLSIRTELMRLRYDVQYALMDVKSLKQCFVTKHQLSNIMFMASIGCDNKEMESACFQI